MLAWSLRQLGEVLMLPAGRALSPLSRLRWGDYDAFEDKLRRMFGNPDKEQEARKQMYRFKQTKTTAEYVTELKRLAAILITCGHLIKSSILFHELLRVNNICGSAKRA